jgi:hypothetical protein
LTKSGPKVTNLVVAGPESDGHVLLTPNPYVADSVQRLIRISVNQPYDEMREHLSEMARAIVTRPGGAGAGGAVCADRPQLQQAEVASGNSSNVSGSSFSGTRTNKDRQPPSP